MGQEIQTMKEEIGKYYEEDGKLDVRIFSNIFKFQKLNFKMSDLDKLSKIKHPPKPKMHSTRYNHRLHKPTE